MKKYFKLIIILLLAITLCSCKQKQEYKAEEIDATEILNNLGNDKEFIVALLKEDSDKSKELINSLNQAAEMMNQNLYYIYLEHIDGNSSILLYTVIEKYYNYNEVVVFSKDETNGYAYTNFQKLYDSIKNYRFDNEIERNSDEVIEKTVKEAHDLYKKGKIGDANNKLNEVYSSKQAKEEIKNNYLYNITKSWDTYTNGSKKGTFVYHNLAFSLFDNEIDIYEKEGKMEDIEIPEAINNKYTSYHYYIKDDIIYISKTKDGKYKKRYKINSLNNQALNITDLENNVEMNLLRRD